MADSIQLFQFVQKCDQTFGHAFHPSQNRRATISTKTMYLISLSQFMFATATFLMFEATSMFDYGFVFFAIFTISNSSVVYPILVWQSQNTLKFIKTCERFIEKSKLWNCLTVNKIVLKIWKIITEIEYNSSESPYRN